MIPLRGIRIIYSLSIILSFVSLLLAQNENVMNRPGRGRFLPNFDKPNPDSPFSLTRYLYNALACQTNYPVQEEWVQNYASGLVPHDDYTCDIAVDAAGNVYVTGSSANAYYGSSDYVTVKYGASGEQLWVACYDGSGFSNDVAADLFLDKMDNVYVTGSSYGAGTAKDYATVKYNSNGEQQWVARYNGPINAWDEANALYVDSAGNVFVTGYSESSTTQKDFATVKYNSAGVEQWVARYNGPGNTSDIAGNVLADEAGNVYVAGPSTGDKYHSNNTYDYATIKYNGQGIEQWVARYNGPANSNDSPTGIALDGNHNILITGYSNGVGSDRDYATVKYNSSGQQQWVARYNGPASAADYAYALVLDKDDNIYITGKSRSTGYAHDDMATIKYSTAGAEQWVARYSGPGIYRDQGDNLAVDASGNVYVTGFCTNASSHSYVDYATIKYNSSGIEQWVASYNGPNNYEDQARAICLDKDGNIFVTGLSDINYYNRDYATIKYDSTGAEQWVSRYDGRRYSEDRASACLVDQDGHIYITGTSGGNDVSTDYATIKYDETGTELWTARFDGLGHENDEAMALFIDTAGNVFVTGSSYPLSGPKGFATVKYNSDGAQQWVATFNGPGNDYVVANDLYVDEESNVYVAGQSGNLSRGFDFTAIKYDPAGQEQWAAVFNGPGNSTDAAEALAVDANGNVYVTGTSRSASSSFDILTIKYNSIGQQQWVAYYADKSAGSDDGAVAISLDDAQNIYIAGYTQSTKAGVVIKYDVNGAVQWVTQTYICPKTLALDTSGSIYITGVCWSASTGDDFATVKYNAEGAEQWIAFYNGPNKAKDNAAALALDDACNVYVTGSSISGGAKPDIATVKYNPSGEEQWSVRYNGPGDSEDHACAVNVSPAGEVYVAGTTVNTGGALYVIVKYKQTITGVVEDIEITPERHSLSQNYPNPFNAQTAIEYQLPAGGHVELEFYNSLGQMFRTMTWGRQEAGIHKYVWDGLDAHGVQVSSGIYFYRLVTDTFVMMRKMILLR